MTWVYPGKGPIGVRLDPPKSIRLFTVLFWAFATVGAVADIYFWDDTLFEIIGDEVSDPDNETWMQLSLIGALAIYYATLVLLWFFIAEKRSRFAKWFYIMLCAPYALGVVLGFEEYAVDALAMYGTSAVLFVASACFLFTPEARHWFAGKIQIDPSVFE